MQLVMQPSPEADPQSGRHYGIKKSASDAEDQSYYTENDPGTAAFLFVPGGGTPGEGKLRDPV